MEELTLRTALKNEVKLDGSSLDDRGMRGWTAVEVPGKYWVQAFRREKGFGEAAQRRQWLTCDFQEALRFARGDDVESFSLYAGVLAPSAASGFIYGQVHEVSRSEPAGAYLVKFGDGLSVVVGRDSQREVPALRNFVPIYKADNPSH